MRIQDIAGIDQAVSTVSEISGEAPGIVYALVREDTMQAYVAATSPANVAALLLALRGVIESDGIAREVVTGEQPPEIWVSGESDLGDDERVGAVEAQVILQYLGDGFEVLLRPAAVA